MKKSRRKARTRLSDKPRSVFGWILSHAKDMIAVGLLIGAGVTGMNHFATAADVDKKFDQLSIQFRTGRMEDRKKQVEDKLDDLRETAVSRERNAGRIKRLETELDDLNQKLRDLHRKEK